MLVTILDPAVATTAKRGKKEVYRSVSLQDPQSGKERDYVQLRVNESQCHLLEMQSLEANNGNLAQKKYASWFVGNYVVSDGQLYVMTQVDPLFFLLPKLLKDATDASASQKWQPLEQILEDIPEVIHACLGQDKKQLGHICDSYEMDEDEFFFKFSKTKTLKWLEKKQQAIYQVLRKQLLEQQESCQSGEKSGAFASGFNLSSETSTAGTNAADNSKNNDDSSEPKLSSEQLQQVKQEGIQVVCNYLNEQWQTEFLNHLDITKRAAFEEEEQYKKPKSSVTSSTATPKATVDATAYFTTAMVTPAAGEEFKTKAPPPKLSFGQKQLAKVNKKGMKNMTSFFAVKKKA